MLGAVLVKDMQKGGQIWGMGGKENSVLDVPSLSRQLEVMLSTPE